MQYTIGNWTVESQTTDSISSTKSIVATDLSYATDYTMSASSKDEVIMTNVTGATLEPVETVRFARTAVADVYANTDVPASSRIAAKQGVRTLTEVKLMLKATNSVSGMEALLPIKGWICLQVPTASMVTPEAIQYALTRTIATAFATGKVDAGRVTEIARGDLTP